MNREPVVALLTPGEVAAMLGVHPKTVTRWAQSGKLKSVRTPGNQRRYSRDEVYAVLGELAPRPGNT